MISSHIFLVVGAGEVYTPLANFGYMWLCLIISFCQQVFGNWPLKYLLVEGGCSMRDCLINVSLYVNKLL